MNKDHLIIVPCHGIWKIDTSANSNNFGLLSENWFLAPFQYEGNDHLAFIKQSLQAIKELLMDYQNSILLFSGSQTKKEAGPISEAQSYHMLISKLLKFALDSEKWCILSSNITDIKIKSILESITDIIKSKNIEIDEFLNNSFINTEEYSLDSLDNLLYSMFRFNQITQNYPDRITIVGFGFKKERFLKHHSKALDISPNKINYISIEPQPLNYNQNQLDKYFTDLHYNENKNALSLFRIDWYGQRSNLFIKKNNRNPFKRFPNYENLKYLHLNDLKNTDEEHFKEYIMGKMPWSNN